MSDLPLHEPHEAVRPGSPALTRLILAWGLLLALLHMAQVATLWLPDGQFKALHLCLCLGLLFLTLAREAGGVPTRTALLAGAILSVALFVYIHLSYETLITERIFGPNAFDMGATALLLLLVLVATTRQWGWTLPVVAVAVIFYAYFGNYLPGDLLFHAGIGLERLASYLAIPSFQGMLGSLTGLSAGTVFIFMLFVGSLKVSGGLAFVMALGHALAGRSRSAPAMVAISSSGFMGMISGSTVANVASTGAMTIPLMKRAGFKAEEAAAIESVASTGGQFTPPVMGLTAFLIVGLTGISYNRVMLAAIAPAIVYYAYIVITVHFRARMAGTRAAREEPGAAGVEDERGPRLSEAFRRYGHLLLAIALLVALLVRQYPPALAALYTIGLLALSELGRALMLGKGKVAARAGVAVRRIFEGLCEGAVLAAQLAVVMATIGIFVDMMVTTGFAQKLSYAMLHLAEGELWVLLGLTAFACLVFGLGLPTPAAYVLVALLGVPALVDAGVGLLHAHMFVFYFANMSALTPPVALAPLVASKIAGASYFRSSMIAMKLGLAGFLLPFLFVLHPEMLTGYGFPLTWIGSALTALAVLLLLNAAASGEYAWRPGPFERLALLGAAAALLPMRPVTTAVGILIVLALVLLRRGGRRGDATASPASFPGASE